MGRLAGGEFFPFAFEGLPPYPDDGMIDNGTRHLSDLVKYDMFFVGGELVFLHGDDPMNEDHIMRHLEMHDHPMHKWAEQEERVTAAYHEGRRSGLRNRRGW